MKFVYFTHSLTSCWNHGNAHFQRGLLRELEDLGHRCVAAEPEDSWSRSNLLADCGPSAFDEYTRTFPSLKSVRYQWNSIDELVADADVVIVHEWTAEEVINRLSRLRRGTAQFILLFHDTHHRAITALADLEKIDLDGFDGVLAFGKCLADVYKKHGWGRRCFVLHEAADVRLFTPKECDPGDRSGVVWVGNWGDNERSEELREYLLSPARASQLTLDVFGVRYPAEALSLLKAYGARYRGWLPNTLVPSVFAAALATVHVPRRAYSQLLPGIPTIRVFEALACGIPLVSAPWVDEEGLFVEGAEYIRVTDSSSATRALTDIQNDAALRTALMRNGPAAIRQRHTCRHRALELLDIIRQIAQPRQEYRPCA